MARSSLEQDIALLERVTPADWNSYTIIKLNVVSKTIYHNHVKTMKILQKILSDIVSPKDDSLETFLRDTYSRDDTFEQNDTD